jgi:GTP-binding protein
MSEFLKILRETKHYKTEVNPQKLGGSDVEIAFVGRSNVGKSSLINAICQRKNMAYTSQVPGKTRTINVYEVVQGRWIVDLPGYGYAVGLKNQKDKLGKIIEDYLHARESLCMVFVIIDAVAGPTQLDHLMLNWLQHYNLPFSIVVGKLDKIKTAKLEQRKSEIAGELSLNGEDILWASSVKKSGIEEFQRTIAELLQI